MKNNIDYGYLDLLQDIMDNGVQKGDRTGTGTRSIFGRQIRHDMSLGFPLLTTKAIKFQNIKSELAWFLSGSSDIRELWKRKCYIWDGDWYKNYKKDKVNVRSLKEMRKLGISSLEDNGGLKQNWNGFDKSIWNLGPIYGSQWRKWKSDEIESFSDESKIYENGNYKTRYRNKTIDQIKILLKDLEHNPDSRRMLVNAWNVGELNKMTLPPCHYGFQVYTRELSFEERKGLYKPEIHLNILTHKDLDALNAPKRSISLTWIQRSVDTPLGLPYNIASYALLLEMLASEFNMVPGELIGQLGDVHIYNNQIDGVLEQLKRKPGTLPTIEIQDGIQSSLSIDSDDVRLINYNHQPSIEFILSN